MQKLTEIIIKTLPVRILSDYELEPILEGTSHRRFGLVKRAIAAGELIQVRRGLYAVAPEVSGQPIDTFELAERVYGPSYVSLESALAAHGLIPEAVRATTSVTSKRSAEFNTPLGLFSYNRIPTTSLFSAVERRGTSYIAEPLKALTDFCYVHKKDWASLKDAENDLRLDEDITAQWRKANVEEILPLYGSRRVRKFLKNLRKELPE